MAISEKTLGPWHPKTATSLIKLALLDDAETARPLIERALVIREKTLGSEHPDTAASLMRLAYLLHTQGDLAGARSLLERALAINEKALGLEHPATALCLTFLSDVLREQGNLDGARLLLERALVIGEKLFGRDESLMQRYAGPYALMLLNAGRANKALAVSQSALATQEGASDGKHPWIKFTADVTARALDELGRTEDAKALRERYGVTDLRNQTSLDFHGTRFP